MKNWLVALILILSFRPAEAQQPIDIVFDIDWTTFYTVHPENKNELSAKNLEVEGKFYRPTDYLPEVIEFLLKNHSEVRISFFSGGTKARNIALLNKVTLSDGRSLLDISHRILSFEDLTRVSHNETLKFSEQYKKVLSEGLPDWNPQRTLLIDDQPEFAQKPLKSVSSLGHYNFQESFDAGRSTEKFFPASYEQWQQERRKALVWLAIIENALAESSRSGKDFAGTAQEMWLHATENALLPKQGERLINLLSAPACQKVFVP
ncbi:MAG: hypothetical protein OM95_03030 [Bdellovibrio sp. ArHS]|uniref:hypothetical protein n=1 Tax=Bdellovibrio sp. ArHS TaxID=1569284 RepID=UPI0005839B2A|nr:hypothetical protein [Bdellovibrio sp. ArHS]KHD89569.1 MAG: hypothetical protein OM95_03030 [Bdellovibrio sp. ArHS]